MRYAEKTGFAVIKAAGTTYQKYIGGFLPLNPENIMGGAYEG